MIRAATILLVLLAAPPAWSAPDAPRTQTTAEAEAKSTGCRSCHVATDDATMHANPAVVLGCTDCHGGDASIRGDKRRAHVQPRFPGPWKHPSSANPERSYTLLNRENPDYIRFVNPGDYRVARESCGACHLDVIQAAERSLMSTGAMLWGGASYNNGILPLKNYALGEAYTRDGTAATIRSPVKPTEALRRKGVLEQLMPLPAWEVIPPGDVFRVFERGGRNINPVFPEVGLPNPLGQIQRLEEPGRPDIRQSNRGPGTGLRVAVPVINIHKTRLNDPNMWFLGTNDQPGDFRSSGCTGCHVVYANDRDPRHSGPYARFGNMGATDTSDPTIPRNEPGHPLKHSFTRAIPTSQCMVCHMHQPNVFLNSMLGYTMWDYESDADAMWPAQQKRPTDAEMARILERNPEEAAVRGKWGDLDFLREVARLNPTLKQTQFADYHGHGWNFRAVFKQDRKGNLLDADGTRVAHEDPDKFRKAVHLSSVHVDKGMHCVDCHFGPDNHGNGYLYGEVADAIEIQCKDCHGSADKLPTLRTSGPAAPPGGRDLSYVRNSDGRLRFEWRDGKLLQRSAVTPGLEWQVSLVKDSVDPAHPRYNERAARAKLMARDLSMLWGPAIPAKDRAHQDEEMMCVTCHTSWTTSCSGCHLPIQANWKTDRLHFEGGETRNLATYNPQVARDDTFQLGRHSTVKNNIIAPVRSSSALILSSTNINRERIYIQQPPIAASGFSSQAFAPHYPHTERKTETKTCTDCHLSAANDNNAIMAQLLLLGTNYVNFVGFNAWTGTADGVEAVQVTEWDEPQAVIGSYLHSKAYPDDFGRHVARGRELAESHRHSGGASRCLQLRGEYLWSAEGGRGLRVYDVASIANKGVSQRIVTAPASPLGQDTNVASADATCVALPTNQPIAPGRNEGDLMRNENQEQAIHPIYRYALVTDAREGLILVDVATLADGEPRNNFLTRALTWNEGGVLDGARHLTITGHVVYVATPRGVVVLNLNDPLRPRLLANLGIADARATAVQFRYLFVAARGGLKIVDITHPEQPRIVPGAEVAVADPHRIYIARGFAYVAGGAEGLVIVDVERPEAPRIYQRFTADGRLGDVRDVVVGSTNASAFAYVADGGGGLKVVQLTSPSTQPGFYGFNPDPKPELIAWRSTGAPALALSKGLDRDRAVDETGNQIAVFGRLGSRPLNLEEMRKLFLAPDGSPWTVTDEVRSQDLRPQPHTHQPVRASTPRPSPNPRAPLMRRPGG